jgi:hypothetical protein
MLIDLAAGGTPVDLGFAYTLCAPAKLVLTAPEVYLPKPKLAVEGAGGDFRGGRTRPPGACSPSRSRTTSTGQCIADHAACLRLCALRTKLEPDAGDPFTAHIMDNEPDHPDPDGIAHRRLCAQAVSNEVSHPRRLVGLRDR